MLLVGHGAISSSGPIFHTVTFNRDVSNCAFTTTLTGGPAESVYTGPGG